MSDLLRARLLETYRSNQGALASPALYDDPRASWPHLEENYAHLVEDAPRDARVLELGGGPGQLLAWLRFKGFTDLTGVDASPGDVAHANTILGDGVVIEDDGFAYSSRHRAEYDIVVMKALLEHVPKDALLSSLEAAAGAVSPEGRLIVEVPNMDWLLAQHERYLDLTHEVGFTRQSLTSLLTLCFGHVEVTLSRIANPTRSQRLVRPLLVKVVRRLLYILGEGADDIAFASRSLIAVCREPRS